VARLAKMHLGGNHEFSTCRRAQAAILSHGLPELVDETCRTAWIGLEEVPTEP
jgi:hypothetical protein